MPRAVLVFRLPAEDDEFCVASDGWRWREVVREMDELLRQWEKYGAVPPLVERDGPEYGLREELRQMVEESGLSID